MSNIDPQSEFLPHSAGAPEAAAIDVGVLDALFVQVGPEYARALVENCFAEFDYQIQLLEAASNTQDWAQCLAAIHVLRGISVEYGAVALSEQITAAKNALLMQDFAGLLDILESLKSAQKSVRTAILVRLAKCTATQVSRGDPNWPAH